MNREIKFRGFSETFNKWFIGVPYFSEGNWWILVDENTKSGDIGTGSYFADKNSIGQYTGLKDKLKREIFECDILRYAPTWRSDSDIGVVKFQQGTFVLINLENDEPIGTLAELLHDDTGNHLQIIGNIYENPELLN